MKCTESEDEEPTKGTESHLQLSCFINQEVKYLATGLRLVSMKTSKLYNPGGQDLAGKLQFVCHFSGISGTIFPHNDRWASPLF